LPVTVTTYFGSSQSDTIVSGVIFFMSSGSWGIALIIFIASIIVPIAKLVVLVGLLISIQKKSAWRPEERTRLYRITELVGRWSMLDVFVVALLVVSVKLGSLAQARVDVGIYALSARVILTMLLSAWIGHHATVPAAASNDTVNEGS
jgi:paraquat-inducible protein A